MRKIEIRIPEEAKLFDDKITTKIETKEELFETMEYIAAYGTECGIVYHTDEKVKRMIRFQPAELMYIYISEKGCSYNQRLSLKNTGRKQVTMPIIWTS